MNFRVVLDTNVIISSQISPSKTSPSREIFERFDQNEFQLLIADDLLAEYIRKLLEKGVSQATVTAFIARLILSAERVFLEFFHERAYAADSDDIPFQLCAINGNASHLVTYDSDFEPIRDKVEFRICRPIEFLDDIRRIA